MLRLRLSLLLAATVLLAVLAFAGLAGAVFARSQDRDLAEILHRELTRVNNLLATQSVGERFLDAPGEVMTLQFVTRSGRVALPGGNPEPLPLETKPTIVDVGGQPMMVASDRWLSANGTVVGTVRLGMNVQSDLEARRTLRRSLFGSGLLIALAAMLADLLILGRTLRPLGDLAEQADRLDPGAPRISPVTTRHDEVGRVQEALQRALSAIRERRQAERDALAEVAHELAGPLSVVAGRLDALAEREGGAEVGAARDAARELLYTSQDLLTLARGELDLPLDLEASDVREVAERVAGEYPGVKVEAVGDTRVLANPQRLAQVVRNLVRNAVQAASAPQAVFVQLEGGRRTVRLTVRDDGPGLDEVARSRAFDRYYTRRSAAGGSGVGLSVVRTIVEAHGGTVGVTSDVGKGSVFFVTLPSLSAQIDGG